MTNKQALSFLDLAREVLLTSSTPLTYQEIWELGEKMGLVQRLRTSGKTPWQSLGARLYVEVRDNPDSTFIIASRRPARFFLKSMQAQLGPEIVPNIEKAERTRVEAATRFKEKDLHPILTWFAYSNPAFNRGRSIYTKTIRHEKSLRSGFNEWMHPDMVGFYLPLEDWRPDVIEFNRILDHNSLKLFSFEIKKSLNKANYREAYFQAVSNSSWAHEGYLVAPYVLQDDEFLAELDRLASSFGIGVIQLNLDDIDGSLVLYPARTRTFLDWEMVNKLCEQNADFARFIQDVRIDFESKRVHKSEYDSILEDALTYAKERF